MTGRSEFVDSIFDFEPKLPL